MRHRFQIQPALQLTPIEKIRLPLHSRDELPPILAGLQWVWMHPTLKSEILALIEAVVLADKKATNRPGLHLWQILVRGVVRLGLDADWDRMEPSPTTMPSCARGSKCPPYRGVWRANRSAIKRCGTTSRGSTKRSGRESTRASPPPGARCS